MKIDGIKGCSGKTGGVFYFARMCSEIRLLAQSRFIITVLIATVLHAVACIIAPPFEFGHNRAECFFSASVSGLLGFPVMFAVVVLPLRWGLRRLMPQRMQRAQAIVAGLVLLGLAAAWVFTHPTFPFQHGLYIHWLFWSTVAIAVTISFFWPFGARRTPPNKPPKPAAAAPGAFDAT